MVDEIQVGFTDSVLILMSIVHSITKLILGLLDPAAEVPPTPFVLLAP
jgi:hypothetical protein